GKGYMFWPIVSDKVKSTFEVDSVSAMGNGDLLYRIKVTTRMYRDVDVSVRGRVGAISYNSVYTANVFDREIDQDFLVVSDDQPGEQLLCYALGHIYESSGLVPVLYHVTPRFLEQVYDEVPLADRRPLPGDRSHLRLLKRRDWTVGKYQRFAEFVALSAGKVHLRIPTENRKVVIPLEKFSDKDQIYVRQYLHAKRAVEANGEIMLGGTMDKRIPRGASVKGLDGYKHSVVNGVFFKTKSQM
ncbi:MAG: hypothetical protein AB8G99_14765, partial [Planctomycetaceae bacterium]